MSAFDHSLNPRPVRMHGATPKPLTGLGNIWRAADFLAVEDAGRVRRTGKGGRGKADAASVRVRSQGLIMARFGGMLPA